MVQDDNNVAMVVTTAHRGVFFGYGRYNIDGGSIELREARMCIYFPAENHGVLGLAAEGPLLGARVGPAIPSILLKDITSASRCTAIAIKRWESAPWSS